MRRKHPAALARRAGDRSAFGDNLQPSRRRREPVAMMRARVELGGQRPGPTSPTTNPTSGPRDHPAARPALEGDTEPASIRPSWRIATSPQRDWHSSRGQPSAVTTERTIVTPAYHRRRPRVRPGMAGARGLQAFDTRAGCPASRLGGQQLATMRRPSSHGSRRDPSVRTRD
jgi:hypothetical protein